MICETTLLKLRTLSPKILKGLSLLRKQSLPLSDNSLLLLSLEILPFPPWIEKINLSLAAKPTETFCEGNGRKDKTDVPPGPSIVVSRLIISLKAKQGPRGEVEIVALEEVHYTTKDLDVFANSFKHKSGEYV